MGYCTFCLIKFTGPLWNECLGVPVSSQGTPNYKDTYKHILFQSGSRHPVPSCACSAMLPLPQYLPSGPRNFEDLLALKSLTNLHIEDKREILNQSWVTPAKYIFRLCFELWRFLLSQQEFQEFKIN